MKVNLRNKIYLVIEILCLLSVYIPKPENIFMKEIFSQINFQTSANTRILNACDGINKTFTLYLSSWREEGKNPQKLWAFTFAIDFVLFLVFPFCVPTKVEYWIKIHKKGAKLIEWFWQDEKALAQIRLAGFVRALRLEFIT